MASTKRQAVIALGLGTVLVVGACALWLGGAVEPKVFGGLFFGAIFAAAIVGNLVKTPASRLPAVVILRERPQDVAYIVAMNRGGTHLLALAARNHELLAPPLKLKGHISSPKRVHGALQADASSSSLALEIIATCCPAARATTISDHIGLASPGKLVKKAIAELAA